MDLETTIWADPAELIARAAPEAPVLMFAPARLRATAQHFLAGFPGLVTYAVKANPSEAVIANLAAAGIGAFDVASPAEMDLVRALVPQAALHYNNPVRSPAEIARAVALGVASYAVDSGSELEKLIRGLPAPAEIAVRFKLDVPGAAYDFGAKFGATPDRAAALLQRVARAGHTPALTFHPGTQCTDAAAWTAYVAAAAEIARMAGAWPVRLNVGGGFPAHRGAGPAPGHGAVFAAIARAAAEAFGNRAPALLCEPGRGMVADCAALVVKVKAVRDDGAVFLTDGIYGALAETAQLGLPARVETRAPDGRLRQGQARHRVVFGPTCDSLDRLPGEVALPADLAEGDYLVVPAMGAYSSVTATPFNGYGAVHMVTALALEAQGAP